MFKMPIGRCASMRVPRTAICILPACGRSTEWPEARGRPPAYCCQAHQRLAQRRRQQLQAQLDRAEGRLSQLKGVRGDRARDERATLTVTCRLLAWHLLRYPQLAVQGHGDALTTGQSSARSGDRSVMSDPKKFELEELAEAAAAVEHARAQYRAAVAKRDKQVRVALAAGASNASLALATGLTRGRVSSLAARPTTPT